MELEIFRPTVFFHLPVLVIVYYALYGEAGSVSISSIKLWANTQDLPKAEVRSQF